MEVEILTKVLDAANIITHWQNYIANIVYMFSLVKLRNAKTACYKDKLH